MSMNQGSPKSSSYIIYITLATVAFIIVIIIYFRLRKRKSSDDDKMEQGNPKLEITRPIQSKLKNCEKENDDLEKSKMYHDLKLNEAFFKMHELFRTIFKAKINCFDESILLDYASLPKYSDFIKLKSYGIYKNLTEIKLLLVYTCHLHNEYGKMMLQAQIRQFKLITLPQAQPYFISIVYLQDLEVLENCRLIPFSVVVEANNKIKYLHSLAFDSNDVFCGYVTADLL